jgi:hypothetical protein
LLKNLKSVNMFHVCFTLYIAPESKTQISIQSYVVTIAYNHFQIYCVLSVKKYKWKQQCSQELTAIGKHSLIFFDMLFLTPSSPNTSMQNLSSFAHNLQISLMSVDSIPYANNVFCFKLTKHIYGIAGHVHHFQIIYRSIL